MAVTLNASTSSGLVQTADTSGVITLQNNGTDALSVSSGNLQFNSGYGSVATAYGCRAWVNFNGTGTVAIRASGNVLNITDNAVGDFTINLITAMPDVNFAYCVTAGATTNNSWVFREYVNVTTSTIRIRVGNTGGNADVDYIQAAVFR